MRDLFVEELQDVVGGQKLELPNIHDHIQTTHACCEEGPFGCCGWTDTIVDAVRDLISW